jgi:DHA2 family multidrug resistance protein
MSDDAVFDMTPVQRALVMAMVIMAATIFTATVLISSALLPQLQGALLATQDEVSWTMTFNIVATAVVTPMTGWMAARFGRRATMVWCVGVFSVATFMCGWSASLEEMVFWRIVQGGAGAPLIPLGQAILFDAYPKRMHGTVVSIYGMANMAGPVIGPMFAGEIAENLGWRWGFWMVLPVCIVAFVGLRLVLPRDTPNQRVELDWTGFLTLTVAIGAAQLVFSRGQRLDWFDSLEIGVATCLAALAFYMFIAHSLTASRPFIDLALFRDRNYAIGSGMVTLYGMLNFAPIVLLPPLLKDQAGFPDSLIGEIVGYRGAGAVIGFFIAMMVQRFDPRAIMIAGTLVQTLAGAWMMSFDLNVAPATVILNSLLQGVTVGLVWTPLTVVTFSTLPVHHRAEAMAMFHLLRTFGSSLFISVAVAEIVRATGANYARLGELISPFNRVLDLPWAMGAWDGTTVQGLARLAKEINRQAIMLGYGNAFVMYTVVSAAALPLILLMRVEKKGTPPT